MTPRSHDLVGGSWILTLLLVSLSLGSCGVDELDVSTLDYAEVEEPEPNAQIPRHVRLEVARRYYGYETKLIVRPGINWQSGPIELGPQGAEDSKWPAILELVSDDAVPGRVVSPADSPIESDRALRGQPVGKIPQVCVVPRNEVGAEREPGRPVRVYHLNAANALVEGFVSAELLPDFDAEEGRGQLPGFSRRGFSNARPYSLEFSTGDRVHVAYVGRPTMATLIDLLPEYTLAEAIAAWEEQE